MQTRLRALSTALLLLPLAACGQSGQPSFEQRFARGLQALDRGNYAEAYCYWHPLAERGYADAQYRIGWFHANGHGMPVDVKTAIEWWTKAAKQGHVDAELALGLAYTNGDGIKRDPEKALTWYLAAAKKGQEDARDIIRKMVAANDAVIEPYLAQLSDLDWLTTRRTVKSNATNVRDGPGLRHKVVATFNAGDEVRALRSSAGWTQIVLSRKGDTGWVLDRLLDKNAQR